MLVECIDISNKPEDIPQSQWVKKKVYTMVGRKYHPIQKCWSLQLEEVQPPPPYIGYKESRFRPIEDIDITELIEVKTEVIIPQ